MIRDPDSPAGLLWRMGWLAGTAVPPPPEPVPQPEPEYGVKEVTTWGGRVVARRSLLRDSIRVELDREAQRVYVAAQREVDRQIGAAYGVPPAQVERRVAESNPYHTVARRCVECDCEARRHAA